jgi:hypothetical protein
VRLRGRLDCGARQGVGCYDVPNTVVGATEGEGFDDSGNRAVRVESYGVRQGYAQDAIEAIICIFAVLEAGSEVFEVHVVVGKGRKGVAAVDSEEAPNRRLNCNGRGLRARKRPDAKLLRDERGGSLVNVDNHQESVELGTFDASDVDRSAVCSVTLIMRMRRAVAEGVLMRGVASAARCAIVGRAMGSGGIEAFDGRMMVRWACRFRVAEAGLGT